MLNQDEPKDYVLASGETHTIKEFVEKAFKTANIYGSCKEFDGDPLETAFLLGDSNGYTPLVTISEDFYRPAEGDLLLGDPTEAKKELNWSPKVDFKELAEMMYNADYRLIKKGI